MRESMSLDDILRDLDNVVEPEKTASAKPTAAEKTASQPNARGELHNLLSSIVGQSNEKTAAAPEESNPVNDLQKIASELANADYEALVKEGHLYGAAIADGFAARWEQYQDAVSDAFGNEKTASYSDDDIASIGRAAIEGFIDGQTKLAADARASYEAGLQDTFEKIASITKEAYDAGYTSCDELINRYRQ